MEELDGPADRDADADDRRGLAAACRRSGALRSRMRVAILGGTGKFGRALATRLAAAGDDVVDRLARPRARAGDRGASSAFAARATKTSATSTSSSSPSKPARRWRPSRDLKLRGAAPLGRRRGRVRGRLARPGDGGASLAERVAEVVDVPVAAGLHSLAAGKLARVDARAGRLRLRRRRGARSASRSSSPERSSTGARSTRARSRPRARSRR